MPEGYTIKRLSFADDVNMGEVQDTLCLAALCASILHTEDGVQMSFGYAVGLDKRTAVIRYDDTLAGLDAGRLAVGLCEREYGSVRVDVVPNPPQRGQNGAEDGE